MYGQKIRDLRIENKLKQDDLARMLNISQSTITKYEKEQLEPNIIILKKLADIFLCSIDYLVGRESEDAMIVIDSASMQNEKELTLIKSFRKLSAPKQEKVEGYIAGLLED
ncbi:MAG: helix-turn-helix domain-containing protein [Clostridia bacterium]|nr:helix-turn-helix domain-containing protein [Clostridia bacterium]